MAVNHVMGTGGVTVESSSIDVASMRQPCIQSAPCSLLYSGLKSPARVIGEPPALAGLVSGTGQLCLPSLRKPH